MPSNPFGKFGPIVLLAVVQLVLVLAAPSTAPNAAVGANGAVPYTQTEGSVPGAATGVPGTAGGSSTTAAGPGAVSGGSTSATGGGAVSGTGSAPATVTGDQLDELPGSTKHCVDGRQYDPKIEYFAPPCVPGVPGAAFANNGGATWQGVTEDSIEFVVYVADYGAEVNAILKAQGLYYNAAQARQWSEAYAKFLNEHYQFYGRKIHVDTVQGGCRTVPPDYPCLIKDMDSLVAKYHPYAVIWDTTVCSQCFAELSRLHVVNTGGGGFSDAFHNANAPYSYDAGESATRIQLAFADWWCNQMTSQGGSGRTAIFAGNQNPRQNFRNDPRQLGVVSTDDPDNQNTVKNVLYPALKRGCGDSVNGHEYFYAQDINTATQQSQALAAKMNTPTNPATSVVCFCDPVAPQFGQNAFATNNYWPESILASDQTMDWDSNAQTYSQGGQDPGLACPNPGRGCPYDNTIGIGAEGAQESPDDTAAVKVWRIASGKHDLPDGGQPPALTVAWANWNLLGTLIQNTGPILTPARMQAAAPSLPARGGGNTGHELRVFRQGSWCWIQDARIVYWNKNKKSPYNGENGTYVQIEGGRYDIGEYPKVKQPPAPAPENRK